MIDWVKLVEERNAWIARNFPNNTSNDSILGCVEELGELAHAHLKAKQGIRGTPQEHAAAAQDAIGDLMVYLLGVMDALDYTPRLIVPHRFLAAAAPSDEGCILQMRIGVAHLPAMWAVEQLVHYARKYCDYKGWGFDFIVNSTWNHVRDRDWVAHREAGAVKDDPLMKDPEEEEQCWLPGPPATDGPFTPLCTLPAGHEGEHNWKERMELRNRARAEAKMKDPEVQRIEAEADAIRPISEMPKGHDPGAQYR